ncbi:hypothetical protein RB195_023618 [Necator americanus]|uniref:Reverse transcriptase domain-containing protein n=1 Tax=Necator americanus TaxID=51031 RepID=A0ABR1EJY1_NECAM
MWISSRPRTGIRVDGQPIELVDEFCYLGCMLKNNGSYERDVQQRCAKATSAFNSLKASPNESESTPITNEVKLRVYLSAIRPIMMYESETWATPSTVMEKIDRTKRKLLRRLLGYFWPRVCHSEDLCTEIDVVYRRMTRGRYQHLAPPSKAAKVNRLRFFGHMLRRPADRLVQRVLKSSSGSSWKKPPGRKRKFWTEVVKEDLRTLGVDRQFRRDKIEKVGQSCVQGRRTSAKMRVIASGDDISPPIKSKARAYPRSDAHYPRPGNVANMRELSARGRSRPKKLVRHRQQHPVRLATLNVATLTAKSRELADSLRKRCVDICCVQETRFKGSKSRELGDGYKLIYHGTSNCSGVGIILNESFRNSVTAVDRLSVRLMAVKVDTGEVELRVASAYAPQMGCSEEEEACFWEDLEQYVQSLEGEDVLPIGGDFNGHVGSRKDGFESCHGGYGFGARNDDGLRILEYAAASDLIIANTQYRKRKWHLITYTSGGRETQIDFWMLRRRDRRLLQDSKVIPTDHVAAQHHLLVMDLKISRPRKRHPRTETQRIKWWNLKDRKEAAIREKKSKYKLRWRTRQPDDRDTYLAARRETNKAVSKADRYKAVYDMFDTREGERAVYRLVRARHRSTLDMEHTKIVKGADGVVLRRSGQILERWRDYYNHLCNEEFCHPPIATVPSVEEGRTPDVWQTSVTVPVWKGKRDIADCTSYRPIRLLCHTMKDCSTIDAIHAVRILLEKHREKNRSVHLAFLHLEKAFDRVAHELLWISMRSHRVPEEYVWWRKLFYAKPTSIVRCAAGTSRSFPVQVGVHQGSSLSPLLFILCMDTMTKEIQKQHPWTLLFADDVMLASESRDDLQKQVQSWMDQLQQYGLRLNTSKTEYMECGPRIEDGSIRVDGTELNKVNCFKHLGSKVTSTGDIDQEGRARVNAAWMKWKMATGVLCDRKVPVRLKSKIYRTVVRPVALYGCECWPTRKALGRVFHAMEMPMLRWTIGVTLKEKVSNDTVRSIFGVVPTTEKMEARLRWFGHVLRREENSVAKTALKLDVSGVRPRGRPKIRWLDRVKLDMIDARLCTADAMDRTKWKTRSRKADPATMRDKR